MRGRVKTPLRYKFSLCVYKFVLRQSRFNGTRNQSAAISSISQRTFFGSVLTATQERAGFPVKYLA